MHALELAIGWAWLVFWIYWLVSASASKESVRGGWRTRLTGVSAVSVHAGKDVQSLPEGCPLPPGSGFREPARPAIHY